jgi:hypothetical protein|nr:MAG TPA: hypothetical protein [Caudoviricetes sp.]
MLRYRKEIIQDFLDDEKCRLEGGEEMSEEQKKKIDGVLHEMKHMNPQQIEVMITYMQGMATAAKLMQAERKEA